MIVRKDKTYEACSSYPDANWYKEEDNYVIDETTEKGKLLAKTYIDNYPYVDFEHENEFITKVISLEEEKLLGEQKLQQERLEQELLESLKPSQEEILKAETELQIIELLMEVGLI